eukprot:TRINITY_DN15332_c0_g1_i1.p1 TRINITY_DN15332_c0_g1~~TRINITY_DN15332_c0_g1_i1.p1  ORF type:complete len:277 (+),score=41.04 TRINITY_DN15332_c0_g1_i1:80-910(+)
MAADAEIQVWARFASGDGVPVMVPKGATVADLRNAMAGACIFREDHGLGNTPLFFDDKELTDGKKVLHEMGVASGAQILVLNRMLPKWDEEFVSCEEEVHEGTVKFDDWTVTRLATQDEAGSIQVRPCGVLSDGVHVWRLRIEWDAEGPDAQEVDGVSVNHSLVGICPKSEEGRGVFSGLALYLYERTVHCEGIQLDMTTDDVVPGSTRYHGADFPLQSGGIIELHLDCTRREIRFSFNDGPALGPVKVPDDVEGELVAFVELYGIGTRATFVESL